MLSRGWLSHWWLVLLLALGAMLAALLAGRTVCLRIDEAFADLDNLRIAIAEYRRQHGAFPARLGQLAQHEPPILSSVPNDPWGEPYAYVRAADGSSFLLYSRGHDRVDQLGAGDDVTTRDKAYACDVYGINCPLPPEEKVFIAAAGVAMLGLLTGLGLGLRRVVQRVARRPAG
jgi:hypothetical protein